MTELLRDCYSVWWADLRILRHLWPRFLVTSLMTPLLYLVAFGFGLGRSMHAGGSSYLQFVLPGIVALTSMNASYSAAGTKLNVDRLFYKCFDEILMAPVSLLSLVLGKAMVGVVRGLLVSTAIILIGVAIAALRVDGLFVLTVLVSSILFALLGVLAALIARSHQDMTTFSSVILTPMTFLGGTFFSYTQAPGWLRTLLYIMPLVHVSNCLRARALALPFPWLSFAALVVFAAGVLAACLYVLRKASI